MLKHDLERIGSAVFKHSANLKGSAFSAKKIRGKSKKMAEIYLQDLQLFGCMETGETTKSVWKWEKTFSPISRNFWVWKYEKRCLETGKTTKSV